MSTPEEQWRKDNGKDYRISDPADDAFIGEGKIVTVRNYLIAFAKLRLHMPPQELVVFTEMTEEVRLASQERKGRKA